MTRLRHPWPRAEWLGEVLSIERRVEEQNFRIFDGRTGFLQYCVLTRDWCLRDGYPDLAARIQGAIDKTRD